MIRIALVICCLAGVARGDATDEQLARYTQSAEARAAAGQCGDVTTIAERVWAIAPDYYATTFSTSPAIARCLDPVVHGGHRSPPLAFALALGTPVAGVGLLVLGFNAREGNLLVLAPGMLVLAIGPTIGRAYAGKTWSWWMAVRLAGFATALGGLLPQKQQFGGLEYIAAGGLVYTIGALGEIATAPRVAIDHNNALDEHQAVVVPMVTRGGGGLALAGSF